MYHPLSCFSVANAMSRMCGPAFKGPFKVLNPTNEWEKPDQEEVADHIDGEQEAMPDIKLKDNKLILEDEAYVQNIVDGMDNLKASIFNASKGLTEGTDNKY